MDFDLGTLCFLGIILVLAAVFLPRLLGGMGGSPYSQRGSESPTYDDPNIQSRGGFGRARSYFNSRNRGSETRQYDSPDIQSRGGFGGSSSTRSSSPSPSRQSTSGGSRSRSYDSPKIQSRGGFGGSKRK
jgi:uncharacterized protein YgiB involved in biofilm formation